VGNKCGLKVDEGEVFTQMAAIPAISAGRDTGDREKGSAIIKAMRIGIKVVKFERYQSSGI
jgi:hypothetical protein